MQFTSHKAVYSILPKVLQLLPNTLLDNYIIQCIRQIDAKTMYENKIALIKVTNGIGEMPKDFVKAHGVFYQNAEATDEDIKSLMSCLTTEPEECLDDSSIVGPSSTDDSSSSATISQTEWTPYSERYKLIQITDNSKEGAPESKWIMRNIDYGRYMCSGYMHNCWRPLLMSDKLFTGCYTDKNSVNKLVTECDYRYSFDKCGHIRTTLPDGYIKLAYMGRVTDDNGDYVIPDNFEYINVIKQGVIALYWEEKRMDSVQGSRAAHREYERKFYNGVASLRGSALLPKGVLMDRKLRNIIFSDIAIANDYSLTGNSAYRGGALYDNLNI